MCTIGAAEQLPRSRSPEGHGADTMLAQHSDSAAAMVLPEKRTYIAPVTCGRRAYEATIASTVAVATCVLRDLDPLGEAELGGTYTLSSLAEQSAAYLATLEKRVHPCRNLTNVLFAT